MKASLSTFTQGVNDRLAQHGWRKRAGEIFTRGNGEFIGWLGLNRATKYEPIGINPVVGIRYQPLERQVALLMGTKPHAYVPPTLSSPVGYLRPEAAYLEVKFASEEEAARAVSQVTDLVSRFGHPFIDRMSSATEVCRSLEAGEYLTVRQYADYRLPVLYALMGDPEAAAAAVLVRVLDRKTRSDAEADAYRSFAGAVDEWLGTDIQ